MDDLANGLRICVIGLFHEVDIGSTLPVWKCTACEKIHVGKSVEDIRSKTKHSGNTYILMRHGEADQNIKLGISCHVDAQIILLHVVCSKLNSLVNHLPIRKST